MRWRYLKLDFPYLIGELVIVVLGVLIALAANGWYEDLNRKQVEHTYLTRLLDDLTFGGRIIEGVGVGMGGAREARIEFQDILDHEEPVSENILPSFLYASEVGFTQAVISHDVTYQELISTGNLNIISDQTLRMAITEYYRRWEDMVAIVVASRGETIDVVGSPQSILMATTGRIVGEFTQNDDDTSNDVPFSVEENRRILQILNANKDKILLESNWQLSLQSVVLSRQSVLAELNRELISKIEGAL